MVQELVALGANVNHRDGNLERPLHVAARGFRPQIARFLIENGADVDVVDRHGNSSLHRAVFDSKGRGEVIELLIAHHANPHLQNHSGVSPKTLAETIANYDVAKFFQ
jgi:ankyrin repeat protein